MDTQAAPPRAPDQFVDPDTGALTVPAYRFLLALMNRTGGAPGSVYYGPTTSAAWGVSGAPYSSQVIGVIDPAFDYTIPASLDGTTAYAYHLPTASWAAAVKVVQGGTLSQIGTITIANTGSVTLAGTGGSYTAGTPTLVFAPSTPDTTAADIGGAIAVVRTSA